MRRTSDVDLLVTFDMAADWDLLDLVRMKAEIEQVLGRRVDLVERAGLESSDNWIIRNEILSSAKQVYAVG
jgi:predicted nucleotidyltransferase